MVILLVVLILLVDGTLLKSESLHFSSDSCAQAALTALEAPSPERARMKSASCITYLTLENQ
jgi:phosphoglycolate phosphatase-like HAD superfamily hydrolase